MIFTIIWMWFAGLAVGLGCGYHLGVYAHKNGWTEEEHR